jgi:hypothetical protein
MKSTIYSRSKVSELSGLEDLNKTFVKRTYFQLLPDLEPEIRSAIQDIAKRGENKIKAVEWYKGLPLVDMEYDAATVTTGIAKEVTLNRKEDSEILKILNETPQVKKGKFSIGVDIVSPIFLKNHLHYLPKL